MNTFNVSNDLKKIMHKSTTLFLLAKTKEKHDKILSAFTSTTFKAGMELNKEKCKFGLQSVHFICHLIEVCSLKPDHDRFKTFLALPTPKTRSLIDHLIRIFAYYAKWIPASLNLTIARETIDERSLSTPEIQAIADFKIHLC